MTLRTLNYGNYGIFLIMGSMTLRTLNYGNYGIFLIMGNAGFCPSAVPHKEVSVLRQIDSVRVHIGNTKPNVLRIQDFRRQVLECGLYLCVHVHIRD